MLLKFLLLIILLAAVIFTLLWVVDPIVQVYDQSQIDINNPDNYVLVDKLSSEASKVDVSIIFPAYNEEQRALGTLDSTIQFMDGWTDYRQWTYEIILVDDGSTDSTFEVAKAYVDNHPTVFRAISLKKNQGKGGAVKVGVNNSRGKYVLMADVDGATAIEDLDRLMQEMEHLQTEKSVGSLKKDVGMVLGSRAHMAEKSIATREFYRTILMKGFHFLVLILCTDQVQDTQCGFKLFTSDVAKKLFGNLHLYRWAFDIEVIYQAQALGVAMKEVSVNWHEVEGSKLIRTKLDVVTTSLTMARDMLAVRLAYVFGWWKLPSVVGSGKEEL